MKITVLRVMPYSGSVIYVLQFQYVFMYLFHLDNQIHMDRALLKPRLDKRLLWNLGLIETPYSQDEKEEAEKAILSGAVQRIDLLKSNPVINPVLSENKEKIENIMKGLVAKPLPIEA
ncbi:MAG: hypothetical protein AAB588_05810 [Patescibacteria group bacterium]